MINRILILTGSIFALVLNGLSQDNGPILTLPKSTTDAKILAGKIAEIYPNFPQTHLPFCLELSHHYQTSGDKIWHSAFNYPQVGFSWVYTNLGNKEILGQSMAIYPHLILNNSRNAPIRYHLKFGLGLAYFNKSFDANTNSENFVIGSKLTSVGASQLNVFIPIKNKYRFTTGLFYYHYSNGHLQVPNVGANIVGISLGYQFLSEQKVHILKTDAKKRFESKIKFGVNYGMGLHEVEGGINFTGGSKYPVYTASLYLVTKIKRLSKLSSGLEMNYHTLYHDHIINHQVFTKFEKIKASTLIYYVSYEQIFHKLAVFWQAGMNIYNPFNIEAKKSGITHRTFMQLYMANKFGFRYYLKPQDGFCLTSSPYLGLNIKSQGLVAHFVEIHIGYLF